MRCSALLTTAELASENETATANSSGSVGVGMGCQLFQVLTVHGRSGVSNHKLGGMRAKLNYFKSSRRDVEFEKRDTG